jgi:hypothetical protein
MRTYILRVYRTQPEDMSVSGIIEDVESGQKKNFHGFTDRLTVLEKYIGEGQLELPELTPEELASLDPVAMPVNSQE